MAGIISNKYTGADSASPLSWGLVVEEVDGVPTVGNVNTIIVSNGTLTDNGGGVVTILTSGGGGGGIPSGPQYAVQLNDGSGNFVGSANFIYDYAANELTVNGKIIMNNIVEDPTGIDFSPAAANPGTTAAQTLWSNSTDADNLYYGANAVLNDASTFTLFDIEDDTTSTTTISRFDNLEMSGGTGISTALAAGPELIFTNTGVTSILAGTGITVSGPTGAVTITSSTIGTVTSVATANSTFVSLAGGPITTTGTLTASLSATGTADATTFLRGDNTWVVPSPGMITFTVSGDAGPSQTISDGNNLQILGSTTAGSGADLAGVLDTVAAAGDLLYVETREMTGATGVADGATGFAPKALTGEQDYYLAGDASWKVLPINYSWTVSDGTTTDIISDGETVQFQGTATQLVATVAAGTPALVTYALVNVNTSGSGAYSYPSNITVDLQGRITAITAGASGGGTVTSITFSDSTNTDTITTSGTIEIVGGTAIDSTLNPVTGVFTLTSTGVNSLANVGGTYAGTGASYVIPSAATGSGIDLELTTTGVVAGSYSATNLTVDSYGRLTVATDGSASIVNTKFYIEDDAANNELVSTNDTILLKEGAGGVSVVVSNPDTVTFGLDTTGAVAGSYIAADITVDAYGRLSAASQGTQFSGGANVGIVPTAAAAASNTYLEKDGTWTDPLAGLAAGDGISFVAPTISVNLTASTGLQFNGGTSALEGTTFTTANIGMVPAPGAINNYFLRDDGTWVAGGGTGTVTSVATANSTFVSLSGGPITTTGTLTASLSATGTASAGTFLRGDNTWATPGGGFSNFNISDGVTTQTINSTDTITFTGGTALTGAVSATDTVTYSLDNTAVTPGSYTYGSFTVDQQGRLTAASSGGAPGTMSSWILTGDSGTQTITNADTVDIAGGTGITTAASATDTLTVTLADTAVTPGSYTYSSLTVDAQGRLTAASSGTSPGTMSSFTAAGSSGPSQTISDGDTFTIAQGTGITSVASATDTITITNTGVTSNVAGTGISVSGATGAVTISNTGVTSIVAGTNISISGATGAVTISSTDQFTGTVTSVATSSGTFVDVTGGPITTTGTITGDLSATGTASATTFLRGDNTWASPAGSFTFDVEGSTGTTETISSGDTLTIAQGTGITAVSSATDTVTITNILPFNSLTLAGDTGSETVVDQDTITIAGGTGLTTVAAATDTVTVTLDDTSVTPGSYTYSSFTVDQQGRLTDAASGSAPGTMSDFIISDAAAATQIVGNGNTITFVGGTALTSAVTATDTVTFNLDDTSVTPGSYTYSSLTVDQQGRLTAASSGSAPGTMSSFDLDGDSGSSQTISEGDTMTIAGGTGLSSVAANFDTVTLNLDNTAVAAGSYTYSSLTVDAQGRLTAASSGVAPGTMDDFIISDGVTTQTISDGETLTFDSGTFIDQTVTATDTVTSDLSATGSAGSGTFLRGDNTWATPAGGFSNFDIDSDPATVTETINSGETITFTGGSGLTAAVSVTDTVTLSLDNTAVSAGSYTYSSLTVDAQGRLTAASSGAAPGTMSSWDLEGDGGTPQVIADGDTVDIAGGTGIETTTSATDRLTVDLADTVVTPGSYTYSSLTVDQQGRLTAASSGGAPGTMDDFIISDGSTTETIANGDTLLFTASTGISAIVSATDTLTITNTGVTSNVAGTGISVSGATGAVTISNTLPFNSLSLAGDSGPTQTISDGNTITIAGGTGLSSVASVTDTITLNLDNTAVTAGSYGSATEVGEFTVDAQGRLTLASDVAITFPFSSFDIVTDPATTTETIADGGPLTFDSGTFITQTVAATDTVTADLSATGTASASTFLRGDNTWASPAGSFTFDVEGSSGTTETISSGDTLIIAEGTGITSVASNPDTITITNTGVTSAIAGSGIGVSAATGAVTISNTGVTSIVAGTNISISGATGAVTINSTDQYDGTVTSVATSSGTFVDVTGGPITTTGTITGDLSATGTASATTFLRGDNTWGTPAGAATSFSLTGDTGTTETVTDGDTVTIAGGTGLSSVSSNPDTVTLNLDNTAVSGGSYTYASLTVDAQGRLTAASSGATPGTMSDWTLQGDGGGAPQTIADGNTVTIAGGTGLTTTASATDTVTIDLDTTAVAAGDYGSATEVATFTVDAQGRLTAAADVSITAGVTSVSGTTPINVSAATGAVTISSDVYAGTTVVGYVPTGGSATTYLRGDGTWSDPGAEFNFTVDADTGAGFTVDDGDAVTITAGTTGLSFAAAANTITLSGTLDVDNGGTGQTSYTDGQLLIGNTTGNTLAKGTLTAGSNISITNGSGAITIASSDQYDGTVTSVALAAPAAFTVTGSPVTTSGTLTFAGAGTSSQVVLGDGTLGTLPTGTMSSFNLTGDTGTPEVISDGDTVDIAGGTGISTVVSATDTVTITNTGVTSIVAGTNVSISGATGAVTISSTDQYVGTVTSVATSSGTFVDVTGGIITTTGTITGDLSATGTASASTFLRGDNTWATPSGTYTSWTLAGDSGSSQTITDGNTATIAGGTGLSSVASATDTVTLNLDNTAVSAGSYTYSSITVDAQGRLTSASSGSAPGTMSTWTLSGDGGPNQTISDSDIVEIAGGTGITTTASATDTLTVDIEDTAVTPGSYTYSSLTVDQQGRLTAASSGATPGTMDDFIITGDSGTQTISDGNTFTLAGGTGLTSAVTATDTVTYNLDYVGTDNYILVATTDTTLIGADSMAFSDSADSNTVKDIVISNIPLSVFDNDDGWTSNVGTVTSVATSSGTFVDITGGTITATGTITGDLSATGTASATTFLRGDNTWSTPTGAFSDFIISDGTTTQTISDGDTLLFSTGAGITAVVSATDTLTITNTGVTSIVAGTNISVSGATGAVTIDSTDQFVGTVTSVDTAAGTFISGSGGPITTSGSLTYDLSATGTPGATTFLRGDNTWGTPAGSGTAALTATYVGYGDGSNLLTGTANYTWTDGSNLLTLGSAGAASTLTGADGTASAGSALTVSGGDGVGTNEDGGTITLTPGAKVGTGTRGSLVLDYSTYPAADATGVLTSSGAGVLSWGTPAGTYTFDIAGDTGVGSTIASGDTVTINAAGTGLSFAAATDTFTLSGTLDVDHGGTGLATTPTAGQLLIGNTTNADYDLATLTAGTAITITNTDGSIEIANSSPGGSTTFDITGDGAATETISDGATFTLTGGTGLTSAVTSVDTVTYTLDDTAVTPTSYGSATEVATFTVDQQGRLTAAADQTITFPTVVTDLTATTPINVDVSTGSVTISSDAYAGAAVVGYVPTGGSAVTYLRGDGSWVNPPGSLPFNSLTLAADSGVSETVLDGDTITFAGGTGLASVVSATDTITFNIDYVGTDNYILVAATETTLIAADSMAFSDSADSDTVKDIVISNIPLSVFDNDAGWTANAGTVTSVGLALPAEFSITGSPVTSAGTLTGVWTTQTANTVFAGPTTGAAATPAFRALVAADVPNPSLTATEVGYGSVANALTGISTFTFDDTASAETLTIGTAAGQTTLASADGSGATAGANLNIFSGDGGTTATTSGSIRLISGVGGSTSGNSGSVIIESGVTTSVADATGAITIRSGSNADGRGTTGPVTISTTDLIGAGIAGDIILTPGNTVGGTDGNIILDYATWPIADAASAGDVLSSNAAGVLSWTTGSNSLTATYVGYGDGANALTGTSNFTWLDALGTLTLAATGTTVANIAGPTGSGVTPGGTLNITAGAGTGTNSSGGEIGINAGNSTGTGTGGSVVIRGGTAPGSGAAGSISLFPANSGSGTDGDLILDYATWPDADGNPGEVLSTDGGGNLSWAGSSGSMTSFDISDGITTQTIVDGNTITFTAGAGITAVVSATDTLTITNTLPFNNLTLAGDSGPSQTINDTNTITIAGGTGISSVASATDTITLNLDDTAVTPGSYTYSSITVDQQGRLTAASSGVAQVPGGATTNVQFNNAGSFDGDANFAWTTGTGSLIVNDLELTNATGAGAYTITGQSNNITLSDLVGGTITIADAAPASAVTASIVDMLPYNIVAGSKINLFRDTEATLNSGPFITIGPNDVQSIQESITTIYNRKDIGAGTVELVSGYDKPVSKIFGATLTLTDGAAAEEDPLGPVTFFARKRDYNLGTPPIWTTLAESKKMALGSYSLTINSGGGGTPNSKQGIIAPQQESFTVDSQNYGVDYETTAQVALNYQLPHNAYKRQEVLHIDETDFEVSPTPATYQYQLNYKDHAGMLIIFQDTGTLPGNAFVVNMPDATESNVGDTYWLMSIHGTITPNVKVDPLSGTPSSINGAAAGTTITAYQCQRIIAATNMSQPIAAPPGLGNPAGMSWVTMATNT